MYITLEPPRHHHYSLNYHGCMEYTIVASYSTNKHNRWRYHRITIYQEYSKMTMPYDIGENIRSHRTISIRGPRQYEPLLPQLETKDKHWENRVYSFHLAHRLAKYQLQVTCEGQNIPHEDNPKNLGVTLDRTLTFKTHISKLSQKISTRNNLLRRLAGLSWGANFKDLQTAAGCLVCAPAEYCAPAWSSSTHTAKIDIMLNTTMRIVSGCLKSTPTFYLPVVSGIIPPDIRRSNISLKLFNKANSDPATFYTTHVQEAVL